MAIRSFVRRERQARYRPNGPTDLERHVARCRRTGAGAALLVARLSDGTAFPADLDRHLRMSDTWMRTGPGELVLVCDATALDRGLVERRLRSLTSGSALFGWADFPADGLVVEDLLAVARRGTPAPRAGRARAPKLLVAER